LQWRTRNAPDMTRQTVWGGSVATDRLQREVDRLIALRPVEAAG